MITSLEILDGFAAKLPDIGGRKFKFKPKANILFAPNGFGKTTILKIIAGHTGIETTSKTHCGGWNTTKNIASSLRYEKNCVFPNVFQKSTCGNCKAKIEWDGSNTFYNESIGSDGAATAGYFYDTLDSSPDGITDMKTQLSLMKSHLSSGQTREFHLSRLIKALSNPPEYKKPKGDNCGWDAEIKKFEYINSLPKNGPITLLWDEPDKNLSIDKQYAFWMELIPKMTSNMQIIVSTHSIIPLFMPELDMLNIIDVKEGYITLVKSVIGKMIEMNNV